jgi:hypothetical protein
MEKQQALTVPATNRTAGLTARDPEELMRMASTLAASDLVPTAYRNKPSNIFLVGMRAHELGIGLMMALAEMHVIDGKVGMSSDLLTAIVRSSGKCTHFKLIRVNDTEAAYEGKRSDTGEVLDIAYTIDEAREAGLLGKGNWKMNKRAMLMARASARLARELWPDVCMGLYVNDEFDQIQAERAPQQGQPAQNERPRTIEAVKEHARKALGAQAPGKSQAAPAAPTPTEPRVAEIVQDAQPQEEEDPFAEAPQQQQPEPAPEVEQVTQTAHPLSHPSNWYDPSMGGVDVNDADGLELQLKARLDSFSDVAGENVWTNGPLKAYTPTQAIMGGEGGGRHTLLQKAVQFAVSKKFEAHAIPRGALAADWCLALMEKRFALMRAAGLDTAEKG